MLKKIERFINLFTSLKVQKVKTVRGIPDAGFYKPYFSPWLGYGEFKDTSEEAVKARVGHPDIVLTHKGFIPDSFKGLENAKISFAHIDVDIYQSILDSLNFIYPRMISGGFIVFDDYGFPTCPGA